MSGPSKFSFPNQAVEQEQMQEQHTEVPDTPISASHKTTHWLEDNTGIGLWILLGFAGIGFLTVFRKKIKEWLK